MASRRAHCKDCLERLGEPFNEVHKWLDGLALEMNFNPSHRIQRHNRKGVEIIREKFGDLAAQAAEIHIMRDYGLLDNPHATHDDIPHDERGSAIMLAIWLEDQAKRKADPLGHENPYEDGNE